MADEQNLFDGDDLEGGDTATATEDDFDLTGDEAPDGIAQCLQELKGALSELGIEVSEIAAEDTEEFCKHLVTAVRTHQATLAAQGDDDEGFTSESEMEGVSEESTPMLMSTVRMSTVKERYQGDPILLNKARADHSKQLSRRDRRIAALEQSQIIPPKRTEALRKEAEGLVQFLSTAVHRREQLGIDRYLDGVDDVLQSKQLAEALQSSAVHPNLKRLSGVSQQRLPARNGNGQATAKEAEDISSKMTGIND